MVKKTVDITVDCTKDLANIDPIRSARLVKQGKIKELEQLEETKTISLGELKNLIEIENKKKDEGY